MKKILSVVFVYLAFVMPASAVITTDEAVSDPYIINSGHSDEMARLIDLQRAQINGNKSQYKNDDPDWYASNKKVNFVRKVFMYLDPNLDNEDFMQHNTKYTNSWSDY